MGRCLAAWALLTLWLCTPSLSAPAPPQHSKFALVIGNGSYTRQLGELHNPTIDADLVAAALTAAGFDVTELKDASRIEILSATERYSHKLGATPGEVVGFVYYSGHGLARPDDNGNYLLPVDVGDLATSDAWFKAIALDDLLRELQNNAPNATHFVVFDACRDILRLPAPSKTVAKGFTTEQDRTGMFIGFSTSPGAQASDLGDRGGPYAIALARNLRVSGLDHLSLFQSVKEAVFEATSAAGRPQRPWESNGLLRRVYLNGEPGARSADRAAGEPSMGSPQPVSAPITIGGNPESYCDDLKTLVALTGQEFLAVRGTSSGTDRFASSATLDGYAFCSISRKGQVSFDCMTDTIAGRAEGAAKLASIAQKTRACLGKFWRSRHFLDIYSFEDNAGNTVLISQIPYFEGIGTSVSLMIYGTMTKAQAETVNLGVPDAAKPEGYCDTLKTLLKLAPTDFVSIRGRKLEFGDWYESRTGLRSWQNCRINVGGLTYVNCELRTFADRQGAEAMAQDIAGDLATSCLTVGGWTVHQRRDSDGDLYVDVTPADPGPTLSLRPRRSFDERWYVNLDVQNR